MLWPRGVIPVAYSDISPTCWHWSAVRFSHLRLPGHSGLLREQTGDAVYDDKTE